MSFTSEQMKDLLYLRRIYYTRRAVLARQRGQLEQQMASAWGCELEVPPALPQKQRCQVKCNAELQLP